MAKHSGQFYMLKRGKQGTIYIFDSTPDRYFGEGQPMRRLFLIAILSVDPRTGCR
jgi:hypothetical protein